MDQFIRGLQETGATSLLDIGDFTQANVAFLTGLGYRLHSEDLGRLMTECFGQQASAESQSDPANSRRFLQQALQFRPAQFDAILLWDVFERLSRPLMTPLLDKLYFALRPGGLMLAFFHSETREEMIQTYSFRIVDQRTLMLLPRGAKRPLQQLNNRALEHLFERFSTVKFFLSRDAVRELIVRK